MLVGATVLAAPALGAGHRIDDSGVLTIQSTDPAPLCDSPRCTSFVDVKNEDWTDKDTKEEHKGGCTAIWQYGSIEVARRAALLIWRLRVRTAGETYYFAPNDGVELDANDHNDPRQDLDEGGHLGDPQHFKWLDRNLQRKSIHFGFNVYRSRDNALCGTKDPVIFNRG